MNETNVSGDHNMYYKDFSGEMASDYVEDYWQTKVATKLYQYLCWPILIIGLCGNILSFLVFNKKGSMRRYFTF